MLLIYFNSSPNKEQISKIEQLKKEKSIFISFDESIDSFYFKELQVKLNDINVEEIQEILVIDNNQIRKNLPNKFLVSIFSIKPIRIRWLSENGTVEKKSSENNPNTLFIFPGSIIPLSMGSHQRAFNLLYNLSESGVKFDILIPDNPKIEKPSLISSLEIFAENIYFYRNKAKKFKKMTYFKRGIEKRIRLLSGKDGVLQDLFSERAYRKPTESLKRWVNSLFIAKGYENIIVSYAWLINSIQYIEHLKNSFNLICDTHDVQFYRNENILNRKERLFFDSKKEKKLEISLLNKCDYIISISDTDKKILEKNVNKKVISVYPGFDYAKMPVKQRPVGRPIHFGFIGGGMSANVVALKYIIDNWWPVIKTHSPDSILYVAGSISHNALIREASFFDRNIVLLGFVKDIFEFYSKFEVSLNPVLVAGGLNFKSVEAVCAGKHLFTNPLGKECLVENFPCIVINNEKQIINEMNNIEFNLKKDKENRQFAQEKALNFFGNETNKNSLKKFIL